MSEDPRVQQLLDELLETQAAPEQVCASCPELLPQVRTRLRQMRRLSADLDTLFPRRGERSPGETELPKIPGYKVEDVLGRGGMGIVFRALHLRLNRTVALKMILSGRYALREELERFIQEAEAIAALQHPNIVQIYDAGDFEGRPYFTMEWVEGENLAGKVAGAPQPIDRCAAMIATLAEAIQVAHQNGVVHRDLTPANILLATDGTPKITDFGLARRVRHGTDANSDNDSAISIAGAAMGTPSYMAPEQARGDNSAIGPAADIYALGAILYELLTGRPPFRGENATATLQQVMSDEPVSPRRLNPRVPRDLETICLKCLHKDPIRRYPTAAVLAEDLRRVLKGEPITARPIGSLERTAKWARRRPAAAAMILGGSALTLLLIASAVWTMLERGKLTHAVDADLRDVTELEQHAQWDEARLALERSQARLGHIAGSDLRRRVTQAKADLDLAITLDDIRLSRVTGGQLGYYKRKANEKYAQAFQRAALGTIENDPNDVAGRVRASAVRNALVTALDDWVVCATDESQRTWVIKVARAADPDVNGWRDRILDPTSWADSAALSDLASTMPPRACSLSLQLVLADRLRAAGGDSTPFLRRVQNEHPDDFWVNLILGNALLFRATGEAREYYRVALACRPQAAVGYCGLGDALRQQRSFDEAMRYYQLAIDRDPNFARVYTNIGLTLRTQGKFDDAVRYYTKSIELDPNYAWAYDNLGIAYRDQGRLEDAAEQYRKALALEPDNHSIRNELRTVQIRQGRAQEVWAAWSRIIETDPPDYEAWWGYPELTAFLGKTDEYNRTRHALLKRFGDNSDPIITERVARACLLVPGSDEETKQAADLVDRSIAAKDAVSDWIYPYFLFAKGLAEYRQGRFDNTITILKGDAAKVLGPAPRLLLAMAYQRKGDTQSARTTLAEAIASYDWRLSEADSRDIWMYHTLRREAEATILR